MKIFQENKVKIIPLEFLAFILCFFEINQEIVQMAS